MKKILTFVLLIYSITSSFAQTSDEDQRITEIETELKKAVEDKNYEKAANLKKEKELLIDLKGAIAREDYNQATFLKKQLEELKNPQEFLTFEDYSHEYKIGNSGFFLSAGINRIIGYDRYSYYNTYSYPSTNNGNYSGAAIEIGSKWFFNNGEQYMPGLQVTWLKLNVHVSDFPEPEFALISPLNVGFSNLIVLGDNIGLEANLNAGFTLDLENTLDDFYFDSNTLGYNITPEARFVIDRFSIGIEYSHIFINEEVLFTDGFGNTYYIEERGTASSWMLSCNFQF